MRYLKLVLALVAVLLLVGCQAPQPVREGGQIAMEAFNTFVSDKNAERDAYRQDIEVAWDKELELILREQLAIMEGQDKISPDDVLTEMRKLQTLLLKIVAAQADESGKIDAAKISEYANDMEGIFRSLIQAKIDAQGRVTASQVAELVKQQEIARARHREQLAEYDALGEKANENIPIVRSLWLAISSYLNSGLTEEDRNELMERIGGVGRQMLQRYAEEE